MDISWQTTLALACAAVTAAVLPGTLGYATARLEAADLQRQEVARLRAELQAARRTVQQVAATCEAGGAEGPQVSSRGEEARERPRGAGAGERPRGWLWWYGE
ncbi:hypothetical protein GCM10009677_26140 [Sphaerisporangium rubeum]|uniref:Uncharacterized protein n=1 Tax=Sphaerisporangium rubeum TaxID=321317 RepID=A0A7X0IA76_9ACTN|nr:hypothetical protein [Sphaerisporangium rubeum]MBB6471325.1 hypothetical protein [Sphaerisporangium rubeum]